VGSLQDVVNYATAKEGSPYVWGATGPYSFDCSGLVYAAYKAAGFDVKRLTAADYGRMGHAVDESHAVPGDVVYFAEGGPPNGHVGLYIGDGKMIDAPTTGAVVRVDDIHHFGTPITSIRDITSDGSGSDSIGKAAAATGSQLAAAVNPFGDWQTSVLGIALKLAGAAACAALVVIGIKETVKD
jgi:uncharacterized protein YycO